MNALLVGPLFQRPSSELRAVAHAEDGFGVGHRLLDGPERAKRVRGHLKAMVRRRFP
jgi:hypothetical protein